MSSVGKRPSLKELLHILEAMEVAEAYAEAPGSRYFTFTLKVDREKLQESVPDWSVNGLPKPRWLVEGLKEQLSKWHTQRIKEEEWVSREDRFGASIEALQGYFKDKMTAAKKRENKGNGLEAAIESALYAATILRLEELRQRREAGAVYSEASSRREKASKDWRAQEDDRDEMLRRQREQQYYAEQEEFSRRQHYSYGWTNDYTEDPLGRQRRRFEEAFGWGTAGGWGKDTDSNPPPPPPPPPAQPNKRPWHETLGVPANSSKRQINHAYRRLAAKYHPDRYHEADRNTRMTDINTARDEGLAGAF